MNLLFVECNAEKRILVDELRINVFVDDSVKVVRLLYDSDNIRKLVWFSLGENHGKRGQTLWNFDKDLSIPDRCKVGDTAHDTP